MKTRSFAAALLVCLVPLLTSCHTSRTASAKVKKMEQMQKAREKETQKQYEKAVDQHMAHQTKETRKMMKQHKQQAMNYQQHEKKTFFLARWFSALFGKE